MKIRTLITAILLLTFSFTAKAQEFGYIPGYIITTSNDTLKGMVKYATSFPANILWNIKFKRTEKSKVEVFKPQKFKSFLAGGKTFETIHVPSRFEGSPGFDTYAELVVDGPIKLYREMSSPFGVRQVGPQIQSNYYLLRQEDKQLTDMEFGGFRENLSLAMSDYQELTQKINSGKYKKKDLGLIVSEYNKWKASK